MKTVLLIVVQLFFLNSYSQSAKVGLIPNRINEDRFIRINGIEQWVSIRGDSTKPVVLFLHGGPGSPLSPYAHAIYGNWEKDFIVVQWDQRGTGRTYGRNAPEELSPEYLQETPLTIEQMTADGIVLSNYLLTRLKKKKIILLATSWGSVLGVRMAIKDPGLFHAYIGHSQMVNPSASAVYAFEKVYQLAQDAKDQQSLDVLTSLGKPPYEAAKSLGQLMRIIKKYQQKNSIPASPSWLELSPEYNNKTDSQHRSDGDDYSFVNYAGDKRLGVRPLHSSINFLRNELAFKIPVYFIQGKEDIQTPEIATKEYFDKITAPEKKFILLPGTDHGFNQSVVDTQYEIIKNIIKK